MPPQGFWQRTKTGSKVGFDKVYGWVDKLGPPVNRLSNKLGSEAFWPTTLDKESDKAARILRSFCKDGFYEEEEVQQTTDGPKQKQKVLKKIPAQVIKNAKGLAIFTTMRTGLWISGAGGSGIVVARKEDGSWSPPSGIMLHTAGLGFLVGVDIYDCVVVINTQKALDAFSKIRCTLGGEVSAVAGPLGVGGVLDTEVHKRQAPVFTYLKSRGFYAGVQIDGTIVIERTDENERFYNEKLSVSDILGGKVRHDPFEVKKLHATIRAAEGDTSVDASLLPSDPAPGDYELEANGQTFGVPDKEDPDPFGVLALEKEGLQIREAGTQNRASSDMFNFSPSPRSPIFNTFNRQSVDSQSVSQWSHSRRASQTSNYDRVVSMSDMSTQTDFGESPSTQRPTSGFQSNGVRDSIQSRILERPELEDELGHEAREPRKKESPELPKRSSDASTRTGDIKELQPEPIKEVQPEPIVEPELVSAKADEKAVEQHPQPEFHRFENAVASQSEELSQVPRIETNVESHEDDLEDLSDADDEDTDVEIIGEPVVFQQVQTPPATTQTIIRPRIVTVNKAVAPKLPPRNPGRSRASQQPSPSPEGNDERIIDNGVSTPPVTNGISPQNTSTDDVKLSAASVGSVTKSIAQLRAFDDDEDTLAGAEDDNFHSASNSHATSPVKEKFERV